MTDSIEIRDATIEDYMSLCVLFREENRHNAALAPEVVRETQDVFSEKELIEILSSVDQCLLVAEWQGKAVGLLLGQFTQVKSARWDQARSFAYLEELVVSEDFRRRGIAGLLLNDFQRRAEANGAGSAELHVWEANTQAIAFYEEMGFTTKQRLMVKSIH